MPIVSHRRRAGVFAASPVLYLLLGMGLGLSVINLFRSHSGNDSDIIHMGAAAAALGRAGGSDHAMGAAAATQATWHPKRLLPEPAALDMPPGLPMEVYARGPSSDKQTTDKVAAQLSEDEQKQLRELCGRTLYHSL